MKNNLIVGIAALLIVSTGIVHAYWNGLGRPASNSLMTFSENLKTVPMEVGNWVGTDLKPMDPREREVANVDASLERSYKNLKTGSVSSVFIVSGHHRDIAVHTPDQCYVAAGYEMMSNTMKYMIDSPEGPVEAYTTVFKKEDHHTGTQYLRVFWTWSHDGKWLAPDSPRIEFVGQEALYKMYIISNLPQPGRSISEDPSLPFVNEFIPVLNRALFPDGSNSAVGSDPQDALEPAPAISPPAPADAAPPVGAGAPDAKSGA